MKPNPDDRSNNVERIQHNISNTMENIHLANEAIEETSDPKAKRDMQMKNERREEALGAMRNEIRDEAIARKNDYR